VARRTPETPRSGHARLVPRRDRPVTRPVPLPDPRQAPVPDRRPTMDPRVARAGRTAAIALAGTGVFWMLATWAGKASGWPDRVQVLCDLFALAGFGFGLYLTWQAWRIGRAHKG